MKEFLTLVFLKYIFKVLKQGKKWELKVGIYSFIILQFLHFIIVALSASSTSTSEYQLQLC